MKKKGFSLFANSLKVQIYNTRIKTRNDRKKKKKKNPKKQRDQIREQW